MLLLRTSQNTTHYLWVILTLSISRNNLSYLHIKSCVWRQLHNCTIAQLHNQPHRICSKDNNEEYLEEGLKRKLRTYLEKIRLDLEEENEL
jgi:hypothetical protein